MRPSRYTARGQSARNITQKSDVILSRVCTHSEDVLKNAICTLRVAAVGTLVLPLGKEALGFKQCCVVHGITDQSVSIRKGATYQVVAMHIRATRVERHSTDVAEVRDGWVQRRPTHQ